MKDNTMKIVEHSEGRRSYKDLQVVRIFVTKNSDHDKIALLLDLHPDWVTFGSDYAMQTQDVIIPRGREKDIGRSGLKYEITIWNLEVWHQGAFYSF